MKMRTIKKVWTFLKSMRAREMQASDRLENALTAKQFNGKLLEAVKSRDNEKLLTLIKQGADINIQNSNGWGAGHYAAMNNDVGFLLILIENKWNLNAQNNLEMTAAHIAAHYGNEEILRILISHGVDITIKDVMNRTAEQVAIEYKHAECERILRKARKAQDIAQNRT